MNSSTFNINNVRINNIIVTNAQINNENNLLSLENGNHSFNLTYRFDLAVNLEESKLRLVFKCDLQTFEKNKKTVLPVKGTFEIAYFFSIDNLVNLIEDKLEINNELSLALTNIAYSTSRGIIYTRCQGTILNKWILPLMSDEEMSKLKKSPSSSKK